MRKQTKIAALVSAAALLAIGASMTSFAKTGWVEEPEGSGIWQYLDKYEQPVYGEWHRSGNGWFYIGYDGYMVTNQAVIGDNGDLYYVDQDGARVYDRWMYLEATNGEVVQEGWYYFNEVNGKAARADSTKGEYQLISVRKSSTDATKAGFVFDTTGRMQEGWARKTYVNDKNPEVTYYCVQSGDNVEIEVENDFNFVEGQVLTGWAHMFVPEDYCDDDSNIDDYGYGWYYFDGGAMVVNNNAKRLPWHGLTEYYAFDEWGIMKTSLSVKAATPPNGATPGNASVYFDDDHSYNSGNAWTYDFSNNVWYYIVNLRDAKGSIIQRGVKFNSDGQTVGDEEVIRVKSINGQLYGFYNNGTMVTGDVYIASNTISAAWGTSDVNGNCLWNGITFKGDLPQGWYYFNKTENPQASQAGRMMRNTRVTTYDEDGDPHTRYYAANGAAAMNEAYNNYLYDANGDLYLPEYGDNYMLIPVPEDGFKVHTGSRVGGVTPIPAEDEEGDPNQVLINRSGALIRDGVINIDSERQVTVKNYVVLEINYR